MHRLAASGKGKEPSTFARHAELSLLTSIMLQGFSRGTEFDLVTLKKSIFADSKPIKELCCSYDISDAELAGMLPAASKLCDVFSHQAQKFLHL